MEFTRSKVAGRYFTDLTFPSGRKVTVRVQKAEVLNPSVRGGAYKTVWQARFGMTIASGDTRAEAVRTLIRRLATKGTNLSVTD